MVEKKSKKSQKNIFEHLIGQVGLNYKVASIFFKKFELSNL